MENMRQKATTQRNIEKEPLVKNHPWFNDMLVKVVMTGGIKRTVSHYEQLLIDRIIG